MQLLHKASDSITARDCGRHVLDAVPTLMQFIRQIAQPRARARGVRVQQFRALAYLSRRPGDSLGDLAEYLGLTPPAASRMVDALVRRGLAVREPVPGNRRQLQLRISPEGRKLFNAAVDGTLDEVEQRLRTLSGPRRKRIVEALRDLSEVCVLHKPFERLS
jgi:DNA-binding MarR family transcriptional regulator